MSTQFHGIWNRLANETQFFSTLDFWISAQKSLKSSNREKKKPPHLEFYHKYLHFFRESDIVEVDLDEVSNSKTQLSID